MNTGRPPERQFGPSPDSGAGWQPAALVTGTYAGTVTLLDTRTHAASLPIKVGSLPVAVAITR